MMAKGSTDVEVRAAGGVVWRHAGRSVELLLIHRPRYDDWSLPKGKADDDDEGWRACAEREVEEETGYRCTAGPRVDIVRYADRRGRSKEVRYFAMEVDDDTTGCFRPNDEVDEVTWASPARARRRLTRSDDVGVLEAFLAMRVDRS